MTTYGYRAVQKGATLFNGSKLRRVVTIARVIVIPHGGFASRGRGSFTRFTLHKCIHNEARKTARRLDNSEIKAPIIRLHN